MSFAPDYLIHAANILYLFAYLVRDILWLRILSVFAATLLMAYFWVQPALGMTPIYWNLLFTALNLYWIARLFLERRPILLSEQEKRLCELVFGTMTTREMVRILKLGTWHDAAAGECFVARGASLDRLMVIFSGKACVRVDGRDIAELQPGQFIGGIGYITEETAPADIVALEPTRYISWPKRKLKSFMKLNPDLHAALQTTLALDLTKWLKASWDRQPG